MRYLALIRINESNGQQPSEQLITDMTALLDQMTAEGTMVSNSGLQPTAQGARVRLSKGRISRKDGPFTETKEVIGGFLVLEADSLEEAVAATTRFLELHGNEWEIECEVRGMQGGE